MRRADRDVSARDEARNLGQRCDRRIGQQRAGDRVVDAGGLTQGAASGVGGARVQGSGLASSTRYGITGPGAQAVQHKNLEHDANVSL